MTITREELARLREDQRTPSTWRPEVIERLLALAEAHLSEQSRIDAAVAKERERCARIADGYSDLCAGEDSGRVAENIADDIRTPTPTTEEGA